MISFLRKLSWLTRRRNKEEQLAAELQFHLEQEAEERQADGMDAEDAHWAARRELGNLSAVREDARATWSWMPLEQLAQDLRYGARTMLHKPAFTLLAAVSLALGIGANTAIYSFMEALLMRSLPVANPAALVVLKWHFPGKKNVDDSVLHNISGQIYDDPRTGPTSSVFPYPVFESLEKSTEVFATLFAYRPARKLNVIVRERAEVTNGEYVSGSYFRGLGVVPAVGRLIIGDDDRAGSPGVVVFSYRFARERFGEPANAVGRAILINGTPFTAIGVTPAGFFGVDPSTAPDFYVPLHADLLINPRNTPGEHLNNRYLDEHYYWTEMMGRLRPGVTMAQAQSKLATVFARWVAATATNEVEKKNLPGVSFERRCCGPGQLAAGVCEAALYLVVDGGTDFVDRVRQHCEPPAGAGKGTKARNGCAIEHGRGSVAGDPPIAD